MYVRHPVKEDRKKHSLCFFGCENKRQRRKASNTTCNVTLDACGSVKPHVNVDHKFTCLFRTNINNYQQIACKYFVNYTWKNYHKKFLGWLTYCVESRIREPNK